MIKISVIICTYNRAKYLEKAIESILNQSLPKKDYEILVIDNGSIDNTHEVCNKFKRIKYIYEPKQGLSKARNTGLKAAKGKYVAFIDDDAIASKNWLKNIISDFENSKANIGCVCGKVDLIWESKRPNWFSDNFLTDVTALDWSKSPIILNENQWFVGTNMAFPKKVLEEFKFNINLGRTGKSLLSGEETYLRDQLEKKEYLSYYNPKVSVKHLVPKSRLNKSWFRKRYWWQGISNAIIQIKKEKPNLIKRLRYSIAMSLPLIYNPKNWFGDFEKECSNIGRLGYSYGMLFK